MHTRMRSGLKRRVLCLLIFPLAMLALLLSTAMVSTFYSKRSHFSMINSFSAYFDAINGGSSAESKAGDAVNTIISKMVEEMARLRELTEASGGDHQSELMSERIRYNSFLAEILALLGYVKESIPRSGRSNSVHPLSRINQPHEELMENFLVEEIRKYVRIKPNRLGKKNFMGANGTFASIGHACFAMRDELEEYMDYDVGDFCKDDWKHAQRLMVHGCDPLPRRRCFSRAPKLYTKPRPINESLWELPDDQNIRWSHYRCKSFACLAKNSSGKGFFKCSDCFNLTHHERPRWTEVVSIDPATTELPLPEFLIAEVLQIKLGEIRIGFDYSTGTGTFAARMREFNVTIVSATINLGAPFSEMIALRGLVPLYLTINQRLPFFDNTLDMIHTTRFLDGWIDFILLDFVLYDWDRVLRPGGLLWIDSFFCPKKDLEDYLEAFNMLRYKKHKWVMVPKVDKDGEEVFFSAVLEKPPRPF